MIIISRPMSMTDRPTDGHEGSLNDNLTMESWIRAKKVIILVCLVLGFLWPNYRFKKKKHVFRCLCIFASKLINWLFFFYVECLCRMSVMIKSKCSELYVLHFSFKWKHYVGSQKKMDIRAEIFESQINILYPEVGQTNGQGK